MRIKEDGAGGKDDRAELLSSVNETTRKATAGHCVNERSVGVIRKRGSQSFGQLAIGCVGEFGQ